MSSQNKLRPHIMIGVMLFIAALSLGLGVLFAQDPVVEKQTNQSSPQANRLRTSVPLVTEDDSFVEKIRPHLERYCFECHSGEFAEGGINLEAFGQLEDVTDDLETWSQILEALENGDMPPSDAEELPEVKRELIQAWIMETISMSEHASLPDAKIRRMNRVEYENTIRDLFRLNRDCFPNSSRIVQTTDYFQPSTNKMPRYAWAVSCFFNSHRRHSDLAGVSALPVDPPTEHGFSNDQSALSLSPLMMENYYELATSLLGNEEFSQICGIWDAMFVVTDGLDSESCKLVAYKRIESFLPRVFRRDVRNAELQRYFDLYDLEFGENGSYEDAMKTTVAAMLVSPHFLFRQEFFVPSEDGLKSSNRRLMDENFAMANRLSFFLWASMPDETLFQAAREKRLTHPDELVSQVDRMMEDRRVKSLSTDFGMQWLKVQKAASVRPDEALFPAYYKADVPPPAISMMIEQMLLFETIMVENRNILEFVSADFSYLNRQLMDWYQVSPEEVLGYSPSPESFEDFFRIRWPNGHRGGIVASGAMLVSTSTTTRTSPVYRGAWILDVVFNSPPPAPPANVPPLEPADGSGRVEMNVRKRLEQHRLNPACATCHDRMDPMGFSMEKFDAVGRWRKTYRTGDPIDARGDLDGVEFDGAARFKNVVKRDKSRFVKAFIEHTMKYALGRKLHYSDDDEIRHIFENVIADDCRFRAVIKQVVLSEMFRRFDD